MVRYYVSIGEYESEQEWVFQNEDGDSLEVFKDCVASSFASALRSIVDRYLDNERQLSYTRSYDVFDSQQFRDAMRSAGWEYVQADDGFHLDAYDYPFSDNTTTDPMDDSRLFDAEVKKAMPEVVKRVADYQEERNKKRKW